MESRDEAMEAKQEGQGRRKPCFGEGVWGMGEGRTERREG